MSITRYTLGTSYASGAGIPGIVESPQGEYVRHADHLESLHEAHRQIAAITEDYADMAAKNAELERQLEAIGAGGVSLMGDAKGAEIARLREALSELVACKALKEQIAMHQTLIVECDSEFEEMDRVMSEYSRRQPAAWESAKAALTQQEQGVSDG